MNTKQYTFKDIYVYLIFGAVVTILLIIKDSILGAIAIIAYAFLVYYAFRHIDRLNKDMVSRIEKINDDMTKATEHAVFNMPFPLVITNETGRILWYNTPFIRLFEEENIMDINISSIVSDFKEIDLNDLAEEEPLVIERDDKIYRVFLNIADVTMTESNNERLLLFYWVDYTEHEKLVTLYEQKKSVIMLVEIDNYDEIMDATPSSTKPLLNAEVDRVINNYFKERNALVRKFDEDMYLIVITKYGMEQIKNKRFDVLDQVREIRHGNTIPMTLSIGVSSEDLTFVEGYREADTCLGLALGRGGDQAVVRIDDNYEFFGGKSKAVEKRNKVKARVLGIALRQLINKASDVYVMGHSNPDMDAIGSAIGVLRAVENCEKRGFLILEESNPSIDMLLKRMKEEAPDRYEQIISGEIAYNNIRDKDLLILVDNHKPSFTIYPELLEAAKNVVIIDHHRRGEEFVKDPVLTYIEPYASSTSELVTEMLTYMSDDMNLTPFEADALMSGIVVDTKNFTFQTGVRTFEAASILKRAGADMSRVRVLFDDDYETIIARAEVVHNAEIVHDNIAIAKLERDNSNSILIAAQAADELLKIHGVEASFVLTKREASVHISGRSFGNISVQLILEKLGGGGHLNMAGAQVKNENIDEVEKQLLDAIEIYLNEEKGEEE